MNNEPMRTQASTSSVASNGMSRDDKGKINVTVMSNKFVDIDIKEPQSDKLYSRKSKNLLNRIIKDVGKVRK